MKRCDPLDGFGRPVDRDYAQAPKRYGAARTAHNIDGPVHPDPEAVTLRVGLHLARGEYSRAMHVVRQAAYEAAEAAGILGDSLETMSLEQIGIDPKVLGALNDAGIVWASQLDGMSDNELLAIPNIGIVGLRGIRAVLATIRPASKKRQAVA